MKKYILFSIAITLCVVSAYSALNKKEAMRFQQIALKLGLRADPSNATHAQVYKDAMKARRDRDRDFYIERGIPQSGGGTGAAPQRTGGLVLDEDILNNESALREIMRDTAVRIGISEQARPYYFLKPFLFKHKRQPLDVAELVEFMNNNLTPFIKLCFDFPRQSQKFRYKKPKFAMYHLSSSLKKIIGSYKYDSDLNLLNIELATNVYVETVRSFKTILGSKPIIDGATTTLPSNYMFPLKQMLNLKTELKQIDLFKNLSENQDWQINNVDADFQKAYLKLSFIYCMNQLGRFQTRLNDDLSNLPLWTYLKLFNTIRHYLVKKDKKAVILNQNINNPAKALKSVFFSQDSFSFQDVLRSNVPFYLKKALCYILLNAPLNTNQRQWIERTLKFEKKPFYTGTVRREEAKEKMKGKIKEFKRALYNVTASEGTTYNHEQGPSFAQARAFFEGRQ